MPVRRVDRSVARPATLIAVVAVVAVLYFASAVLIPLALAFVLCFLLAPIVQRLERWRIPRVVAVIVVVGAATAALVAVGRVVLDQAVDLAQEVPKYRENLREKLRSVRPGSVETVLKGAKEISDEIAGASTEPDSSTESPDAGNSKPEPVPVRVTEEEIHVSDLLAGGLGLLATLGMTAVLLIFMLLEREALRDRVVHLLGHGRLYVTTVALDEAAKRISRVLASQLLANTIYGSSVGLGLWLIGVPNAMMWGMLGVILRFIPYAGAWFVAAGPILLSLAIFEGWEKPMMVIGLFVVIELIINNAIEPMLYGSSIGVSGLAVVVSAMFWTWLWGAAGLVLALPMTVCIVVAGQFVPQLSFVNTLLSDKPNLPRHTRLYQRLLAMDADEAQSIIKDYLRTAEISAMFDELILPTLSLSERDRHAGALDEPRANFVIQFFSKLLDELESADMKAEASGRQARRMLVIAAHDEADTLASRMLQILLRRNGVEVVRMDSGHLASEVIAAIREQDPAVVCISAVPPNAAWHARYLCRRIGMSGLSPRIIVALWTLRPNERTVQRLHRFGVKQVAGSMRTAAEALR